MRIAKRLSCLHIFLSIIVTLVFLLNLASVDVAKADVAKGKALFAERCASCHGALGAGDGPIAAALPPENKPANLSTAKYKYAVDAAKFKELLQKGGAAVGLNPLMPGAPGASDADINDMYEFVQSLKK